jgi:signal transduction histidine kinase
VPHLFSRFYQLASPERAPRSGLGLGLFICHELVTAHGGRLEAQSSQGVGTTFTVWLPLLDAMGAP